MRRGDRLTVRLDGVEVPAYDGDTVAAVLVRQGLVSWRRTRHGDRPRGLFCGIGACQDCLVEVDGRGDVRACLAPVRAGTSIVTSGGDGRG